MTVRDRHVLGLRRIWSRAMVAWDHLLDDLSEMGVVDFDDSADDEFVDVRAAR